MPQAPPTKIIGSMMMASLVVAGGAASAVPRILGFEGIDPEAAPVFGVLIYGAAAALLALLAWAPTLAKAMDARAAKGSGKILAMATCEGTGLLGIVAAGLTGQSSWAAALAIAGALAVGRVMSLP